MPSELQQFIRCSNVLNVLDSGGIQTAHELAYAIGALAIDMSIVILTLNFLKGQKNIFPETSFSQYGASNESMPDSVVVQETNEKTS